MSHEVLHPDQFGDERECADAPCGHFAQDPSMGKGTCKNCLWAVGAHTSKAGGPTGHGKDPEGLGQNAP